MTETIGVQPPPASRHLCVCADDFGMSIGINSAVFDLAEQGNISATSGMVHRSAWLDGACTLRRIDAARLDVGLHLDLTRPAIADGAEPGLAGLIARTCMRGVDADALRSDIRDQLDRFEGAMGRAPAFVDGHRHVHQLPVVRDLLVEEIARRYPVPRPWLRCTAPIPGGATGGFKAGVIHALGGASLRARARQHGIPVSRGLLGVYDFAGSAPDYRRRLSAWIAASRSGDVLMCHPSAGILPSDPHGVARLREYAALRDLVFPVMTRLGEVDIAPLSRLLRIGELAPA
ncbi:polysacchardie deacetylase domain-containing protein [Variovorax paradoxus B4]|uniref:Polysacchardie deacetylase domain-containing protein n=1 Tax=Variovorax paradoxus B4 TaxID=1246301 RepID=T1X7E5_VARPD|nr:ChbG/HpnK family deacetylase [Variovorax paradoxus]AGU48401.1 polysacchardie deacetylase domain-containing protein [Variovorax paradoxus B4]